MTHLWVATISMPPDESVEIPGHLAEIVAQGRCLGVERGEDQALVAVELRHRNQPPPVAIQLAVIGLFEVRNAGQPPVIAVGPAMIRAGEAGGVAVLGPA